MTAQVKILRVSAAAALALAAAASSPSQSIDSHPGRTPAVASAARPEPLSDEVRAAVDEALQDERRGEAMYARVLGDHGDVRPFSNVVHAEGRHAVLLENLLRTRDLAVPTRPTKADAPAYGSLTEACSAAVEFETRNVALYDRLLAAGPLPGDVERAFDHNRMASLDHHKPAFERCAGVAAATGPGWGAGRGATGGGGAAGCGQGRGRGGHHGCGRCRHGGGRS